MKVNLLPRYSGNAVTRQYKRNEHLVYAGIVAAGTCLGISNLCYSARETGKSFLFGAAGVMFLHDSVKFFGNIIKLAQPYAEISKRAKQIYKNK